MTAIAVRIITFEPTLKASVRFLIAPSARTCYCREVNEEYIMADQNPDDMRTEAQEKRDQAEELIGRADAIDTAADELERAQADAEAEVD